MLRVLLLGLLLAVPGFASAQWLGPPNTTLCNKTVTFTNANASTQLVAPTARTKVLICGWVVTNTAGTGTVTFNTGTQTTNPCDTNTVALSPALSVGTTQLIDHQQYATQDSAVGAGVCVTPSVITISGILFYTTVPTPQ